MPEAIIEDLVSKKECRHRLAVTLADYQLAVRTLLPVAFTGTCGGRIAANLLLSLYDSDHYPFPLEDLGLLDIELLEHAMVAIRGRVLLGQAPQIVIKGGGIQFSRLVVQWPQLRANQRYGTVVKHTPGTFWRKTEFFAITPGSC